MERANNKIKLGIYSIGLLMMGVIGVSGSLATVGAHFSNVSQTVIQMLISVPCIVIIPTTIIVGKLMEKISKKYIAIFGTIFFLVGGIVPIFMNSIVAILVMRGVLGIGVGICQVVSTAIIAEHFSGIEQQKVQGTLQASQMAGVAFMVFAGGWLALVKWNLVFLVHILAILPLIFVIITIPKNKPEKVSSTGKVKKSKLTMATWGWVIFIFVLLVSVQIYSVAFSYLVVEKHLGTSVESGMGIAFFAVGGIIMGAVYGKLVKLTRNCSLAVGCLLLVIAYLIIAYSNNMVVCYIGSFINGMAVSAFLPGIYINASKSVDAFSAGMAISVVTCAQNFGQFACPYIINSISGYLSHGKNQNFTSFLVGAVMATALTVIILAWGIKKNRQTAKTVSPLFQGEE